MAESIDDQSIFAIDSTRLTEELEKFEKITKDCEDSDGATEALMEGTPIEFSDSPSFLDKYLLMVSKTGNPLLHWTKIRYFMKHKIDAILTSFYMKYGIEDVDSPNLPPFNYIASKERLLQHFDTFSGAPFTIQRLCEILIDPTRHYKRTDKLLRGLEKNILVVSTVGRLSEDCSDPQQRSSLFNGLHVTFRTYRPPLLDSIDKFSESVEDVEMKGGVGQQLNGVDPELCDEEEASFETECLPIKLDMEEEEMDELEEQDVRPRLLDGGTATTGPSPLEAYSLASVNSVINSIRRKRKDEEEGDQEMDEDGGGSPKRMKTDDGDEKTAEMAVEEGKENISKTGEESTLAEQEKSATDEPKNSSQENADQSVAVDGANTEKMEENSATKTEEEKSEQKVEIDSTCSDTQDEVVKNDTTQDTKEDSPDPSATEQDADDNSKSPSKPVPDEPKDAECDKQEESDSPSATDSIPSQNSDSCPSEREAVESGDCSKLPSTEKLPEGSPVSVIKETAEESISAASSSGVDSAAKETEKEAATAAEKVPDDQDTDTLSNGSGKEGPSEETSSEADTKVESTNTDETAKPEPAQSAGEGDK